MSDFDRYMADTNGPAYKSSENRNGPPLGYVAEKMKNGLIEQHRLLRELRIHLPDDMSANPDYYDVNKLSMSSLSVKDDFIISPAYTAFYYVTVAYLALMNMLSLAGVDDIKRYSEMTVSDFEKWIEFVDREGSVIGT